MCAAASINCVACLTATAGSLTRQLDSDSDSDRGGRGPNNRGRCWPALSFYLSLSLSLSSSCPENLSSLHNDIRHGMA
ncbi:hypothetical protein LY76DRAFT_223886 [Colletotrichum caudatum]|nr:hypothetical protein LY76DRAFT_223886 [Colletotrichum caudatum]